LSLFLTAQSFQKEKINGTIKIINDKSRYSQLNHESKKKLISELLDNAQQIGYKKGILIAKIKMLQLLITKADNAASLKIINEALPLATELEDSYSASYLYEIKGRALMRAKEYTDARKCLSTALSIASTIAHTDSLHFRTASVYHGLVDYTVAIQKVYNKKVYQDSITYFAFKAYTEAKFMKTESFDRYLCLGTSAQTLGSAYILLKDFKKGIPYLDEAEQALLKINYAPNLASLYSYRGDYEFNIKNYSKGLFYYEKAIEISDKQNVPLVKLNVLPKLTEYYKNLGNVEKQLLYTERLSTLKDSLANNNLDALVTYNHLEKENQQKIQKSLQWKTILIGLLAILIISTVIIYTNLKLKRAIRINNEPPKNNVDIELLLNAAKNNDKQFILLFQQMYPDLYQQLLSFSFLTPGDIELCAFLKLNLQTKEIAAFQKTTIGAVDNRKYRLRKKLNLSNQENLYKWISSL